MNLPKNERARQNLIKQLVIEQESTARTMKNIQAQYLQLSQKVKRLEAEADRIKVTYAEKRKKLETLSAQVQELNALDFGKTETECSSPSNEESRTMNRLKL